jgi:hypothetical protein
MRKTHYYQGCPGVVKHAYDTNDILAYAGSAGNEPVILPKKNRKEQRDYDKYLYKLLPDSETLERYCHSRCQGL